MVVQGPHPCLQPVAADLLYRLLRQVRHHLAVGIGAVRLALELAQYLVFRVGQLDELAGCELGTQRLHHGQEPQGNHRRAEPRNGGNDEHFPVQGLDGDEYHCCGKKRVEQAEDKCEVEAREGGLSVVKLEGNIGCIVNGAGLAMATMDLVKRYGGQPANFLDIGGSSNPQKVVTAMRIILSDPNVEAILFNIFGGITRCDDVANGIVMAFKELKPR
ncbi:hypothetical protein IIA79_07560, partial [bacterium]|nr:hypothetical protein [bacterium]